jgi:hypothetical protein
MRRLFAQVICGNGCEFASASSAIDADEPLGVVDELPPSTAPAAAFKATLLWPERTQKEPFLQRGRTPGRKKLVVSPNSQPLWLRALYIKPLFHRCRWQPAWEVA